MKKFIYLAAATLMLAGCSNDFELSDGTGKTNGSNVIGFQVQGKNSVSQRALNLYQTGHYNFGVFAYKEGEAVNNVMNNYLVGYMDDTNKKGYSFTSDSQTTLGDENGEYNGSSYWAYENLGYTEYNYMGTEGFYTKDQTQYMSNLEKQYLKFWDKSAPSTTFYAYAPYINSSVKPTASFTNNDQTLHIPDGSVQEAYVEGNLPYEHCEYMYAANKVDAPDYGKDVPLSFKRLNAKVNIKFWEDINGYSVRILNLTNDYGVAATPAIPTTPGEKYNFTVGEYYSASGFDINLADVEAPAVNQLAGTTSDVPLKFTSPAASEIGTTRVMATASPTTYYAIPKDNTTGFTFHVSYELTAVESGERIVVKDATVHVPSGNANWNGNTHYTYIFRITKNSNGTTGNPGTIDPSDPNVDPDQSLYPIIFDNCTVEDWTKEESDYNISDNTETTDYSVVLTSAAFEAGTKNIKASTGGNITVKVYEDASEITPAGTFTVTGPAGAGALTVSGGTITIPVGQKTGLYTVTYTLAGSEKHAYHNHSDTYTAQFYVIGNYGISLSATEIGTGGAAATQLKTYPTLAGAPYAGTAGSYSLVYPAGTTGDDMSKVTINNSGVVTVGTSAKTGTYQVKFTTEEGDAYATFEVKNYGFTLSSNTVGLSTTSQTLTIIGGEAVTAPSTSVYEVTAGTGINIDANTGVVTIQAGAATGDYTVTRTVTTKTASTTPGDESTTVYKRTFTVKDVYTLSLSTYVIDNDDNVTINVTATKNGASNVASVSYPSATGMTVNASAGTIHIGSTCPAGTYHVTNGDKTVSFIVKD
ncbi:MAG: fimbrillin family protein [Alloprevotella sp.]